MAFAGVQRTINLLTLRESTLTNDLINIMHDITKANLKSADMVQDVNNQRAQVNQQYHGDVDNKAYQSAMDEIEYKFELNLSDIQSWEGQLNTKEVTLNTELEATKGYKKSFMSMLKQNVKKSFKYAQ